MTITHIPKPFLPSVAFTWVDHYGKQHAPASMGTQHLVYSLRMIYNHTVPEAFKVPGGKAWTLTMCDQRRKDCVYHLMKEVIGRQDLTSEHRRILKGMKSGYDRMMAGTLTEGAP